MTEKNNDLKARELLVIYDRPSTHTPGSGIKFVVIQYYKPGGRISDRYESSIKWGISNYWKDANSEQVFSKPKMMGDDFAELEKIDANTGKPIYLTIKALVKNPPPIPAEGEEPPEATAADPESVPFS